MTLDELMEQIEDGEGVRYHIEEYVNEIAGAAHKKAYQQGYNDGRESVDTQRLLNRIDELDDQVSDKNHDIATLNDRVDGFLKNFPYPAEFYRQIEYAARTFAGVFVPVHASVHLMYNGGVIGELSGEDLMMLNKIASRL